MAEYLGSDSILVHECTYRVAQDTVTEQVIINQSLNDNWAC